MFSKENSRAISFNKKLVNLKVKRSLSILAALTSLAASAVYSNPIDCADFPAGCDDDIFVIIEVDGGSVALPSLTKTFSGPIPGQEDYDYEYLFKAIFNPTAGNITIPLNVHLDWNWEGNSRDVDVELLWEALWQAGVESAWSNQFAIKDGDLRFPILVDLNWMPKGSSLFTVTAYPRSPKGKEWPNAATLYAGQVLDNQQLAQWGITNAKAHRLIVAHEAGHWLGNADEYAYSPDPNDNSKRVPVTWPLYRTDETCFSLLRPDLIDSSTCLVRQGVTFDPSDRRSWAQWLQDAEALTFDGLVPLLNDVGQLFDVAQYIGALGFQYPTWDTGALMNPQTGTAAIRDRYFRNIEEWLAGSIEPVSGEFLLVRTEAYQPIQSIPFEDQLPRRQSVSEPATLALLSLGILGMGFGRRRLKA